MILLLWYSLFRTSCMVQ